jgi:hypothetical protein
MLSTSGLLRLAKVERSDEYAAVVPKGHTSFRHRWANSLWLHFRSARRRVHTGDAESHAYSPRRCDPSGRRGLSCHRVEVDFRRFVALA